MFPSPSQATASCLTTAETVIPADMFNQARVLVAFSLAVCGRCGATFFQHRDETICSYCEESETHFRDLLTPAKDQDNG